ncbi:MAG: hypothetical protein IPJ69_06065 [Deltaproteobacteria bacterium]|nr:MAG: hypothetical protein IPJ69_06065 [Deltaproteobacteria bacterium]
MTLVLMNYIRKLSSRAQAFRPQRGDLLKSNICKRWPRRPPWRTPRHDILGALVILLFLTACSGSHSEESGVQVMVHNAFRPAALADSTPLPEMLQVDHFRVTVSGEGFDPIMTEYPADSSGGNITVPVGNNRQVLVEAFNRNGMVIRRRLIENVTIHGDQTTPVVAALLSVPVVTNIRNNSLVRQNRINFAGFGEPASGIQVEETTQTDHPEILIDEISAQQNVGVSINDGNFAFRPGQLSLGRHTFRIRDTQTGEESEMTIQVIPSQQIPGTGFGLLGHLSSTSFESTGTSSLMPQVLEAMTQ